MTEDTRGGRSFDELAKGLASGEVSRRKALRLMGAALAGGALAAIPGVAWAAKGGGGNPAQGSCPAGTTNCQGKCVDLQTNNNNCGQCRRVCSQSQTCQSGKCLGTPGAPCSTTDQCAAGLTCFNGTCLDRTVCTRTETERCSRFITDEGNPYICCPGSQDSICCGSGQVCANSGTPTRHCQVQTPLPGF